MGLLVVGIEPDSARQQLLGFCPASLQPEEPAQGPQRLSIGRIGRYGPYQGLLGSVIRPQLLVQTGQKTVRGSRARIDAHGLFQQGDCLPAAFHFSVGHGQIVVGQNKA